MVNRFLILFSILVISGSFSKNARIIGGQFTDIHEFPHIVSLKFYSTNDFLCAGSIISNQHVLTAAHCVYYLRINFSDLRVHAGSSTLLGIHRSSYFILRIDVHPEFGGLQTEQERKQNDIAILTVRGTIQFNLQQNKIDLPTENVFDDSSCAVCGWGLTAAINGHYSNQLRKSTVKVLNTTYCQEKVPFPILDDYICTFRSRRGTATGDSGGPLTCNNKIFGVISFSILFIDDGPDIHTNVYKHLDFINSIINPNQTTERNVL